MCYITVSQVLVPGAYIFLSLCYLDAAESDYTESLRTVLTEVYPKEDLELRVFFQVRACCCFSSLQEQSVSA